jgi:hypothetical protein
MNFFINLPVFGECCGEDFLIILFYDTELDKILRFLSSVEL